MRILSALQSPPWREKDENSLGALPFPPWRERDENSLVAVH